MFGFLKKKIKEVLTKARIIKKDPTPELENALIEAGVSLEVAERLVKDLKNEKQPKRALKKALMEAMQPARISIGKTKPFVIMLLGINGTGKTTTLAKLAHRFLKKKKTVVAAASDTFRAAAIEQLAEHCRRLKIPLVKQKYGADPAAVAYDAVEHAKARGIDVVLIDTSGRLHINSGLMKELEKVKRVSKPHLSLLVIDATTGNDAVEQAQAFSHIIDGIIIAKSDVDERGGATISVSAATGKPIFFLGTGQEYSDLKEFSPKKIVKELGL